MVTFLFGMFFLLLFLAGMCFVFGILAAIFKAIAAVFEFLFK